MPAMKNLLMLTLLGVCMTSSCLAQEENVISYYAISNSLDGQPMISRTNVLRFYPVYAMRDYTDTVRVTIYYGPHVYTRLADRLDNGRYWQVLLPEFQLGEAIQRMEVESAMDLQNYGPATELRALFTPLQDELIHVGNGLKAIPSRVEQSVMDTHDEFLKELNQLEAASKEFPERIRKGEYADPKFDSADCIVTASALSALVCEVRQLCKLLSQPSGCIDAELRHDLPRLIGRLQTLANAPPKIERRIYMIDSTMRDVHAALPCKDLLMEQTGVLASRLNEIHSRFQQALQAGPQGILAMQGEALKTYLLHVVGMQDTLRKRIAGEHYERLTDTLFSGPSITKADVVIDIDAMRAHVLYRNYKTTLRNLTALDPAEKLGVFRLRYVPFAVLGRTYNSPVSDNASAIFEVGLGFSNVAVSGDDFVIPDLSLRRLGVAFAVTRHLFSEDADVRALVVTFDFNAYGSIGVGANFPGRNPTSSGTQRPTMQSYVSFGINKIAFEQAVAGLTELLNR